MSDEKPFTASDLNPTAADKSFALAAHLCCWVPLLPLGLWYLTRNSPSAFKRYHSLQAAIWNMIAIFGVAAAKVLSLFIGCLALVLWVPAAIIALTGNFWAIYAGWRALKGDWYGYPFAGGMARLKVGVPSVVTEKAGE